MYKRLTNNNVDEYNPEYDFCMGCEFYGKYHSCDRTNGICANFERFIETYNRLAELEDKIENGTLIELPCKVGDTVWYIKSYGFGRYKVEDMKVAGFNFSQYENTIWVVGTYEEESSHIYKTKAEAEAKLRELKEVQNER